MRVVWTAPAARDLEGIGDYIARQNPRAARRIVQRIRARTQALAAHPYLGRPGRVAGTRELVVTSTPFIAVYRAINDRIEILAVFHGARIWPDTF
jgi:toxin ParE1/3/4